MPNQGRHEPEVQLETGDLNIGNIDVLSVAYRTDTVLFARIDDDTITGGTYSAEIVTAPGASNFIYVVELLLMVDAQCELEWVDDPQGTPAINAEAPPMYFAARGGIYLPDSPGYRFKTDTANKAIGLDEVANGAVKVRGYMKYYTST